MSNKDLKQALDKAPPLTEVYVCPFCVTCSTIPSRCYYMCDRDDGTERVRFVRSIAGASIAGK